MEKLESGNCASEVTAMPRDFIERGAPFASSGLRPELERKIRDCGDLAAGATFTGTWSTAWGDVDLTQNGASVTGRYPAR